MGLVRLCALSDVPVGTPLRFDVEGTPICVVRLVDGSYCAIHDRCTHEEETLSDGEVLGTEIECPMHLARFDLRTGRVTALPAVTPVRTYALVERDADLFVDMGESPSVEAKDR